MDTAKPQSGPYLLFTLALSLFTLGMLAVDALFRLDARTREIIAWLDNGVCLLFFLDFVLTFWRAESKAGYFFKWGWLDLLSSIPMVDELRWGRLARVFRIFRILRGLRAAKLLSELIVPGRFNEELGRAVVTGEQGDVFRARLIAEDLAGGEEDEAEDEDDDDVVAAAAPGELPEEEFAQDAADTEGHERL